MKEEIIENNCKELKSKFLEIKNKGWIQSLYKGSCGIGLTFEKALGKEIENLEIPDFKNIEIKSKTIGSKSDITLFNATPDSYLFEIKRIHNLYGYPDKTFPKFKVFNVSIYGNKEIRISNRYFLKLKVDQSIERLILKVYDKKTDSIDELTAWSFNYLKEKLDRKLHYLALIKAYQKIINNKIYFKYVDIDFYVLKNFDYFIKAIENGTITVTFKISVNKSGKKYGQIHDHGTGFTICEDNISELFDKLI